MELKLIRGWSGSGKTTKAEELIKKYPEKRYVLFEADMFFVNPETGVYEFDARKLHRAHEWCQNETRRALAVGKNVLVANTFTRKWEAEAYFEMAKKHNAEVTVINCTGNYANTHGVPEEAVQRMKDRWEYSIL
jgi:predicted kinase